MIRRLERRTPSRGTVFAISDSVSPCSVVCSRQTGPLVFRDLLNVFFENLAVPAGIFS